MQPYPQGYPQYPPQGYPPQQQGYPPQQYVQQPYPPQGYVASPPVVYHQPQYSHSPHVSQYPLTMPPQLYPQAAPQYPAQYPPQQAYPPQAYPPQAYLPQQGYPQQPVVMASPVSPVVASPHTPIAVVAPAAAIAPMGTPVAVPMGLTPVAVGIPPYDPRSDADALYHAMKGIGTDEAALIRVLASKKPAEMKILREYYLQTHKKSLAQALDSETSFNFKTALIYLVKNPAEAKADYLYNAMEGIGTKDHALIDVLTQCTNAELMEVKAVYGDKFGKIHKKSDKKNLTISAPTNGNGKLEADIRSDTSGNFERVLLECCKAMRIEGGVIIDQDAANDAERLFQGGEKRWGTDDSLFINIFTHNSQAYLDAVNRHYTSRHRHSLIEAVKKETSGDYRDALIALATPKVNYIASRLYQSMKGLGTNDLVLIYHLTQTYPLGPVKAAYQAMHGRSLESDVAGDTSGDYKKFLLEIIRCRS